jgi:hypothetical protein
MVVASSLCCDSRPYSASIQFRVLSSFTESASGIRVLSSFAESASGIRIPVPRFTQPNKTSGVYCMPTSKVIFYSMLHISSVGRQFKTFKIKYLGAFGLKTLSK